MLVSRVVVRVRPLTEAEEGEGHGVALSCLDDKRTVQIDPLSSEDGKRIAQSFSMDASVPPDASQVSMHYAAVCCDSAREGRICSWLDGRRLSLRFRPAP